MMLDRIGGEVARATSLVRFAPDSWFMAHTHGGGGEEFLMLEGRLQDEHGSYSAGSRLGNPHLSFHTPWSEDGCLIYVKTGHLRPDFKGLPAE